MTTVLEAGAVTAGHDQLAVLLAEQPRLTLELGSMPRLVWRQPSGRAGWRNARVVAHLAASAELYRESILRALDGDAMFSDEAVRSIACYEVRQERLAEMPASVLLQTFAATGEALTRLFASLSTDELKLPTWHPGGQVPIETLLNFRLAELTLHPRDIRTSIDSRPTTQRTRGGLCL